MRVIQYVLPTSYPKHFQFCVFCYSWNSCCFYRNLKLYFKLSPHLCIIVRFIILRALLQPWGFGVLGFWGFGGRSHSWSQGCSQTTSVQLSCRPGHGASSHTDQVWSLWCFSGSIHCLRISHSCQWSLLRVPAHTSWAELLRNLYPHEKPSH